MNGGAGCLPTDGNVVLRLTWVSLGHGFRRPGAMDLEQARQCWKHLVPTGMHPPNRLFGAGMKSRNGLRKETPPCRSKPACAAARETGTSGLLGRRSIPPPARKAWINKRSTGFGLWRLEKPARQGTYSLSAVWQHRIRHTGFGRSEIGGMKELREPAPRIMGSVRMRRCGRKTWRGNTG